MPDSSPDRAQAAAAALLPGLLSALTRRGFRFEFDSGSDTVLRVTSAGGNALDKPTHEELGELVRGISIVSIIKKRLKSE